jgi:hypothetical protein
VFNKDRHMAKSIPFKKAKLNHGVKIYIFITLGVFLAKNKAEILLLWALAIK